MSQRLRLLLVEDSEEDAELVLLQLRRSGFLPVSRRVQTADEMADALTEAWDMVVSDYNLPAFDGRRALLMTQEADPDLPFIIVSGAVGEETAVEAMRQGAHDYLVKGALARLGAAVARELAAADSRRVQRSGEEARAADRRRAAMAVEATGAGVFEHHVPAGREAFVSERWTAILGLHPDDLPDPAGLSTWWRQQIHPDNLPNVDRVQGALIDGPDDGANVEYRVRHRAGHWVEVSVFSKVLERAPDGRGSHIIGAMLDVTDRRRLEAQMREAQKMEAVGRLAGGVAHDFNNLLTAILSFNGFVMEDLAPDNPSLEDLKEVQRAAERAAGLTRQLLAFSRHQSLAPQTLALNEVICDVSRMLGRILGEDVDLALALQEGLWPLRADPGHVEQVIVNLALNARDAMPRGGQLTIATRNAPLAAAEAAAEGLRPGDYVLLAVVDQGEGIAPETRHRIFEPFFTTKPVGRGTGLGLSTCYGIVEQAGGTIRVDSEVGRGSTFRVYLPRSAAAPAQQAVRPVTVRTAGAETVLVAEDDAQIRALIVRTLDRAGYRVLEAASGPEALGAGVAHRGTLHLLLSDVVMPTLGGPALAAQLGGTHPEAKVLFMSGYAGTALEDHGVTADLVHLLQKPFTPERLIEAVRKTLDSETAQG